MRNIASAKLFLSFSYNSKWKLGRAIFIQKRMYNFALWATQLMEIVLIESANLYC